MEKGETNMDSLNAQRKNLRISFTKCCTKIEESMKNPSEDVNFLVLQKQLLDKYTRLEVVQNEIANIILSSNALRDSYEKDFEGAEYYRDKFSELSAELETRTISFESRPVVTGKRKFKLPKLELQKFDGEARNYLSFWSQFVKIHDDEEIPDEDKFQYLLQAVVPESKAARLVQSFPPMKENYSKVITQLKDRFGRDDLLVQIYVRDLLSMVMRNAISGKNKCDLVQLYDELECKLMCLESLGRTKEKFADFLEPLVESCLPENILRAWERSRQTDDSAQTSGRSLEQLILFLQNEVKGEQMISLARSGLGTQRIITKRTTEEPSLPTNASLTNTEGPTIAAICEYDALPGIGHACGHNLIAEIGLGVGLAVKEVMETDSSISGKIVVLGTPAEEGGGGKIQLIQKGVFEDIDAAVMAHPQSVNRLYPLIVESCSIVVTFQTSSEDVWSGPSAVDAAVACYNNIALIRRTLKKKWRISLTIPTSSCQKSEVHFIYRAPTSAELLILKEKITACIWAAAQSTNCSYSMENGDDNGSTYRGMLYNKALVEIFEKYARTKGVEFHDDDPRFAESAVSSDMGNVTHVVPGMQPEFSIGAEHPHVNHTAGFANVAGSKSAQEQTLVITEALAETIVELMSNPKLFGKVRSEFEENSGRNKTSRSRKEGE